MARFQSIGVILSAITALLVVVLVSTFAVSALDAWRGREEAGRVFSITKITREIVEAKDAMRHEWGPIDLAVSSSQPVDRQTAEQIITLHARSETAFQALIDELKAHPPVALSADVDELSRRTSHYSKVVRDMTAMLKLPPARRPKSMEADWAAAKGDIMDALDTRSIRVPRRISSADPFINEMIKINNFAWRMRSDAGADRRTLELAIQAGKPLSVEQLRQFSNRDGNIDSPWAMIKEEEDQPSFPAKLKSAIDAANDVYFTDFRNLRKTVIADLSNGRQVAISGRQWLELSNPGLDRIAAISGTALDLTEAYAAEQMMAAQRHLLAAIALMLLSTGLATFTAIYAILRVIRPLRVITGTMTSIAHGNLATPIPYDARPDEIGEFARSLLTFRDNAAERERLKTEVLEQRSAKEAADAANRIKSSFLANMSHELRTPLNAILGFSEVLQTELFGPLGHARYKEYADYVHRSGAHLLDLINDVLDLSKIDAGRMELKESDFAVTELVEEAVMMVRDKAKGHCALVVEMGAPLPVIVADKRLIKQVLLNLLSNAIKFTPAGGQVTMRAFQDDAGVALEVADTGIGMDEEELKVAFSPYGQIDSKIARQHQGTGLGLPISRALAELHDGTLTAESRKGYGTTLTLRLPACRIRHAVQVA